LLPVRYLKNIFTRKPAATGGPTAAGDEPRIISEVREMIIENTVAAAMCHDFDEDLVMETIADHTGVSRGRIFQSVKRVNDILPHELTGQYDLKTRLIRAATTTASLLLSGASRGEIESRLVGEGLFSPKTPNLASATVSRIEALSPEDRRKLAALGECGVDFLLKEIIRAEKKEDL